MCCADAACTRAVYMDRSDNSRVWFGRVYSAYIYIYMRPAFVYLSPYLRLRGRITYSWCVHSPELPRASVAIKMGVYTRYFYVLRYSFLFYQRHKACATIYRRITTERGLCETQFVIKQIIQGEDLNAHSVWHLSFRIEVD